MNTERKPLPIGKDNFQKVIESNCYYVDKTLLIKDLLDSEAEVTLFTRPRRFGKTLTQSMLQYFFEKKEEDYSHLFDGLNIRAAGEKYTRHQGQYPVINISFSSAKQPTFEMAFNSIKKQLAKEFNRYADVLNGNQLESQKERYARIQNLVGTVDDYSDALNFLSECLACYYKKPVIILIDEYDVPLENAYYRNFYDEMITFIRSLFETALKTNEYLKFAVITGCLRISKESIFTGLNNLRVISITNSMYAEYFGFTPEELEQMLTYYDLEERRELLKEWYDGYLFGSTEVYNPWSVIQFMTDLQANKNVLPAPYWSNTSSNSIVKDLIEHSDDSTRDELSTLLSDNAIEKPIHEDVTYDSIHDTKDNLWNFLYFTGYLTKVSEHLDENDVISMKLRIPNKEVKSVYKSSIRIWFDRKCSQLALADLLPALESGEAAALEQIVTNVLMLSISAFDYGETFYHGLMIGLLSHLDGFYLTSNRESGDGRFDVQMKSRTRWDLSFLFEFKIAGEFKDLEKRAKEALVQIDEKHYDAELLSEGHEEPKKYGIAFCKKRCKVLCEDKAAYPPTL